MKKPFLVKMALIIVAVCSVLAVSMVLVMNHYARLVEVQALQQEVTYVSAAIGEKQNELLAKARDWATWDDSYNFINNPSQAFVNASLDYNMLRTNKINYLFYMRNDGNSVFERTIDDAGRIDVAVPQELLDLLSPRVIKTYSNQDGTICGLLKTVTGVVVVAVCPIHRTNGTGISPGWVIFGDAVNSNYLSGIESLKYINIEPTDKSFTQIVEQSGKDVAVKVGSNDVIVPPSTNGEVAGYIVVRDIYDNSIMGAKIVFQKNLRDYLDVSRDWIIVALIVGCAVLLLAVLLYFSRVISWFAGE